MDDCIVHRVLQFSFWVSANRSEELYYSQSQRTVKGQALFLVKVKDQGPFLILTQFDHGHSSECRLYEGATPLHRIISSTGNYTIVKVNLSQFITFKDPQ